MKLKRDALTINLTVVTGITLGFLLGNLAACIGNLAACTRPADPNAAAFQRQALTVYGAQLALFAVRQEVLNRPGDHTAELALTDAASAALLSAAGKLDAGTPLTDAETRAIGKAFYGDLNAMLVAKHLPPLPPLNVLVPPAATQP